jgi:hypothetical protein
MKDGEGIVEHVNRYAGEPKAIASTELPEAQRLPQRMHVISVDVIGNIR